MMDSSFQHILPSKVEIQKFPRFQNLPKQAIHVIQNLEQCEAIRAELEQVSIFGFDSESKPTFQVGEVSTGPHLIQLASVEQAYLFQMSPPIWSFLAPFLANPDQLKVGFGLKNDTHLFRKKGFELKGVVELSKCFASFGLTNPVGIKNAIALLFQLNFPKSKKVSTSNWARKILTPEQVDYAAADAYAALLVFEELRRLEQLPKDISKELEKTTTQKIKRFKEIEKILGKVNKEKDTIVPLEMFLVNGYAKLEIGLAKGKRLHDKREDLAKKDQKRAIERAMKQ